MLAHDRRLIPRRWRILAAGAILLALTVVPGQAADPPTAADALVEAGPLVQPEQRPLTPPPGMSIMPSPPMMAPAEGQVQGCPVRDLKPLDLLV